MTDFDHDRYVQFRSLHPCAVCGEPTNLGLMDVDEGTSDAVGWLWLHPACEQALPPPAK